MSEATSAEFIEVELPRVSASDESAVSQYFAQGPATPVIYCDAMENWPACEQWSLDYLAKTYGSHFGLIPTSFFDGSWGKATSLGEYLAHLDRDADGTPGFWVDDQGLPLEGAPEGASLSWAFYWRAFRDYPELFEALGPYPQGCGNLVEGLPSEVRLTLEKATKRDFYSLYISRKGTITPLHTDYHGTIGSLAQFVGTKQVRLIAPLPEDTKELEAFDPENSDFAAFPTMRDREMHCGTLAPGELLIIPPRWWHYVRAEQHSLTMSHNFFTAHNIADFLRGMFTDLAAKDVTALKELLATDAS